MSEMIWRPIETAPMRSGWALLYFPMYQDWRICIGSRVSDENGAVLADTWASQDEEGAFLTDVRFHPTHWAPLPAPPSEAAP